MAGESRLQVDLVQDAGQLECLKEAWNGLVEKNETRTVELTYEWEMTYWKHFHQDARLFVLLARRNGSVVGIAPLKLTQKSILGLKIRILEFIASRESNYQDFLLGEGQTEVLQAFWEFLETEKGSWDVVRLAYVPDGSPTVDFITKGEGSPFPHRVDKIYRCLSLNVDRPWDAYFQGLTRSVRRDIARCQRVLGRMGPLRYYRCGSVEDCREQLEVLFEQHRQRWNATDTPSQFNGPCAREFYLDTVAQLPPRDQVQLWVLAVGDKPIALCYTFVYDGVLLPQIATYDRAYTAGSPTAVLDYFMMKEAFDNGIKAIDMGDYFDYKMKWAPQNRQKLAIELYSPRPLPRALCALISAQAPIREKARRIPGVSGMVRRVRKALNEPSSDG